MSSRRCSPSEGWPKRRWSSIAAASPTRVEARRARARARIGELRDRLPGDLFVECAEYDLRVKVVDHPSDQLSRPCSARWQSMEPGPARLRITGPGGPPFERTITIRPGGTTTVRIAERAVLSLHGVPHGAEAWLGDVPVAADGRDVRLPAGRGQLRVSAPDHLDSHLPVSLEPGHRLELRPTLVPSGRAGPPLPAYVRWSALGVGLASLTGGVAALLMADRRFEAAADAHSRVDPRGDLRQAVEVYNEALAARAEGRSARRWGTGLTITGAVLLVGSGVLFTLDHQGLSVRPSAFTTNRLEMP